MSLFVSLQAVLVAVCVVALAGQPANGEGFFVYGVELPRGCLPLRCGAEVAELGLSFIVGEIRLLSLPLPPCQPY
jgi:hypothetical protein